MSKSVPRFQGPCPEPFELRAGHPSDCSHLHGKPAECDGSNTLLATGKTNYHGRKLVREAPNGMGLAGLGVKRSRVQILSARHMGIRDMEPDSAEIVEAIETLLPQSAK